MRKGCPPTYLRGQGHLIPAAFLGETGVDSSGNWSISIAVPAYEGEGYPMLIVWDRDANLATRIAYGFSRFADDYTIPGLREWETLSNLNIDLVAGGRLSGRFTNPDGGPPSASVRAERGRFLALDADSETGEFISPAMAPGNYSLAYGNLGGDFLNHNDAGRFEVVAGQTTSIGPVEVLRTGRLTGRVTDSSGAGIAGIPRVRRSLLAKTHTTRCRAAHSTATDRHFFGSPPTMTEPTPQKTLCPAATGK